MYFSALKSARSSKLIEGVDGVEPGVKYPIRGGLVFAHDIMQGLPPEYDQCDMLYSDLSWKGGMEAFNKMAQANTDFEAYMKKVAEIAENAGRPVFLVAGKESFQYLKKAMITNQISLNGANAQCYIFNYETTLRAKTAYMLLEALAYKFNCVGDFCCGLGRTGAVFSSMGKRFVMSDINAKCIKKIIEVANG